MKRKIKLVAIALGALVLTACSTISDRGDAARVNVMGQSLNTMSKNLSANKNAKACTVTRTETGWLSSMWSSEESFTSSCEKDPYGEYEANVY